MITTGIFLFLLGTKIGRSSAVQADVKYEPSLISIKEQIDQYPVPELGPLPYLPNFVQQGSNYFFGAPFGMQSGFLPLPPRREIIKEEISISNEQVKASLPHTGRVIKGETLEIFNNPIFTLPHPNISPNFQLPPSMPAISVPVVNSQQISRLPLPPLNIPSYPIIKAEAPCLSMLDRSICPTKDVIVSEVDVLTKKIPQPPQLPPLRLEETFKPTTVEKQIILVPSPPEIEAVFPPSEIMARQPCLPSKCAKNMVQQISRLPLPPLNIPSYPIIKAEAPCLSMLDRSLCPTKGVIVSEVDVLAKKIPQPPQLPPLRLEETFKPTTVEKQIILVPSPPEIEAVFPPSEIVARQPCLPSKCARNIVFERVLPNLAENSKTVELISIPASRGNAVVAEPFLPYIIKRH